MPDVSYMPNVVVSMLYLFYRLCFRVMFLCLYISACIPTCFLASISYNQI